MGRGVWYGERIILGVFFCRFFYSMHRDRIMEKASWFAAVRKQPRFLGCHIQVYLKREIIPYIVNPSFERFYCGLGFDISSLLKNI